MNFEIIDVIFILVILMFGLYGFGVGFFSQLLAIMGLVGGLFLAYHFADDLAPKLSKLLDFGKWLNIVSFSVIFIGILILSKLLNKLFYNSLEALASQGVDKIFGFSYGLIQGILACIILTALLSFQRIIDADKIFNKSILGTKFISVLPELQKLIPHGKEVLKKADEGL